LQFPAKTRNMIFWSFSKNFPEKKVFLFFRK
jgi:hypothetical protein